MQSEGLRFCEAEEAELKLVAGVDEAGRGPLAGSVVAAAVILNPANLPEGLRDSKKLSAAKREQLAGEITQRALCYALAEATVDEIDQMNIFHASLLAMQRAVSALRLSPDFVYVDGKHCPDWNYSSRAVIRGDDRILAIAAASILAKVTRDRRLLALHEVYPQYGFDRHKGYPTAGHLNALQQHGVTPVHRRSYAPVRRLLELK